MINKEFHGREHELDLLIQAVNKKTASLIIIKGRRRIGKTRLLEELAKHVDRAYFFAGLAPTPKTTAQSQRDEFARQMARVLGTPSLKADDWGDLFWFLGERAKEGQVLIVLDEITWMGSEDPDFLGKLKNAWDLYFKHNPNLTLAICGSMSAWIEANILSSTGFMGRPTIDMTIKELPLEKCIEFWEGYQLSAFEQLKLLAITGGVPRYLELINPKLTAEKNIQQLCFSPNGVLFTEFEKIFSDLFNKRSEIYTKIMHSLVDNGKNQSEIIDSLKTAKSGRFSDYMHDLIISGFVEQNFTWNLREANELKQNKYRICDNYSRFYLKYIYPNKNRIQVGAFENTSLASLPNWPILLGLQFETLILNNRKKIIEFLKLKEEDIIYDGPYFQTKTLRHQSCQIDYLIQTRTNNLYVIEIKFSKGKVRSSVINQIREKILKLKLANTISIRPVLIHVNGVENSIMESDFFVAIIDFGLLLQL